MSDLYTTLTHLKMAMNGGTVPPMTPVTKEAAQYIDPGLTIGMGALDEDRDRGLRCPVRGCGKWFHNLSWHLNRSHGGIGGARGFRAVMGISSAAPLKSARMRQRQSDIMRANIARGIMGGSDGSPTLRVRQNVGLKVADSKASMSTRNLLGRCEAQVADKLHALAQRVGHSPSLVECEREYGRAFCTWLLRTYGTWNSAKAQVGLLVAAKPRSAIEARRIGFDAVLEALKAWHDKHGRLPSLREAKERDRAPAIPSHVTIMGYIGARTWRDAMVAAALTLGLDPDAEVA